MLATIATAVIASQSIITGAFSMTRQAMQLGWLPRMTITQTSEEGYGQIYVGAVNWLLMIVTLGLTIGFGRSDNLAAAYGIAVSATMLMTSVLLFIAMREIWRWPVWAAGAAAGLFVIIDSAFLAANLAKVIEGGWVPLLASVVYGVMWIWHRGAVEVQRSVEASLTPLSALLEKLHAGEVARVLASPPCSSPASRIRRRRSWPGVRQNRALHEYVLALTLTVLSVPWSDSEERVRVERVDDKFWRAQARHGFMERPDIYAILRQCKAKGRVDLDSVTFMSATRPSSRARTERAWPGGRRFLFAAMGRNAEQISDYLELPCDRVVEIGREIEI